MLYYLGTGKEFIKAQCKEYKTLDGVLKAAAKDESLVVWDENGKMIGSLTDNIPEGAVIESEEIADASGVNEQCSVGNGQNASEESAETLQNEPEEEQVTNTPPNGENDENEANTTPEETNPPDNTEQHDEVKIPQGKMTVTVVCEGTLNLRRSASWNKGNECGRASRGQTYYVKAIHEIAGKKMVETVDGLFLSGQSEHVQFEQV